MPCKPFWDCCIILQAKTHTNSKYSSQTCGWVHLHFSFRSTTRVYDLRVHSYITQTWYHTAWWMRREEREETRLGKGMGTELFRLVSRNHGRLRLMLLLLLSLSVVVVVDVCGGYCSTYCVRTCTIFLRYVWWKWNSDTRYLLIFVFTLRDHHLLFHDSSSSPSVVAMWSHDIL